MLDLCQYAVSVGEKSGVDEIEAVWMKDTATTMEAQLGQISKASKTRNEGIRIRVIKDKAMGAFFTYGMDKPSVREAVEKAGAAAKASKKDEHWDSLPHPGKYPRLNVWDHTLEAVSSEAMMEPLTELLTLLPSDILVYLAAIEIELQERACCNSNGIEHADKSALGAMGMMAMGKLKEGVTPGFEEISLMREYNPDPQKAAESITTKINLYRKPETASSGKSQIIFYPRVLENLFRYTLFKALSGENVARGKSLLSGKEGEKVARSQVTLKDSGIVREGVNSREMDDEGVPRQDTPLIDEGILSGFIWNNYWGKRMGVASTGNAHYDDRNDSMLLEQTTMVISPGDYTREELFDIKDGYYVLGQQGAHGANPESGDFSVVCAPAYRIRNGEIAGGVTGVMLSDNVFSMLKRIDAIARDVEVGEYAILPYIRFADVNVAAKQ